MKKAFSFLACASVILACTGSLNLISQDNSSLRGKNNLARVATPSTSSRFDPGLAIPNDGKTPADTRSRTGIYRPPIPCAIHRDGTKDGHRKPSPDSKETFNSAVWITKE